MTYGDIVEYCRSSTFAERRYAWGTLLLFLLLVTLIVFSIITHRG